MLPNTLFHNEFFFPKRKKILSNCELKYAWQGREEDLSLWNLIPMEQTRKVEQERW